MFTGTMGRISVFCSYAHEDDADRRELERFLTPLREERVIDDWHDSRLLPGDRWNAEIEQALGRSQLVLFLVTPALLASRYVMEVEIARALERERKGECQVVPVMLRPAPWEDSPLARFQALPGGGRWVSEHDSREHAFRTVAEGIRGVCGRIVDWENPYKRASIGDWTHQEQTMITADGRSATAEGTEELVEKTDTTATVLLEMRLGDQLRQQTMTVDLTRPLDDRMGDMMRQTGQQMPANLEIEIGPAQYGDAHVTIGGRRYETIRARREFAFIQRGQRYGGHVTQWRSIDVPLFGGVKGEAEMPDFRQYQVLLDFGHGDAAARKPRIASGQPARQQPQTPAAHRYPGGPHAAGWQGSGHPPPPVFGPGRWLVQMNGFGTSSSFDLALYPNGVLQGRESRMPMGTGLQGIWMFDPAGNVLTLQVTTVSMGIPTSQDLVQMRLTGVQGPVIHALDAAGRQFALQRFG